VIPDYFPQLLFERNYHHGGVHAIVRSGRFRDFPALEFLFPPIRFNTHEMDTGDWMMRVKQKHAISRPHISFTNENNFGLRLRIKKGMYETLEDVFLALENGFKVEESEHATFKTVPREKILYVDRDLTEALEIDNRRRLMALGEWRPGKSKPDLENVIPITDYIARVETAVATPYEEIDLEQIIGRLTG
jgi:hypothetical protein